MDIYYYLIIDKRPERNYFDKDICRVLSTAGTFITYTDGLELLRASDLGDSVEITESGPLILEITGISNLPAVNDLYAVKDKIY